MIETGIERLKAADFVPLRGRRVGLLTNPSAVDADLADTAWLLSRAPGVTLAALFSPEHGLAAAVADGEAVAHTVDAHTGAPVYSLYGPAERPTPEMLAGLDLMVCDIQDIGVRYYTFLWTLTHVIEACGAAGVPVLVLDRPNPLGGALAGGPLSPAVASIVGRYNIPVQHGMTLGELAAMLNALENPTPAELTVLPCAGWSRALRWADTGLPFVPPSPNMPHLVTAQQYPGACLIEGTTLSEGHGTPLPFEIAGAPGIDSHRLADHLNAAAIPGVRFRAHSFTPTASKHPGVTCHGVQAHILDLHAYQPLETWLQVLAALVALEADSFTWREAHFDRLSGDARARSLLAAREPLDDLLADWRAYQADFRARRAPYLR